MEDPREQGFTARPNDGYKLWQGGGRKNNWPESSTAAGRVKVRCFRGSAPVRQNQWRFYLIVKVADSTELSVYPGATAIALMVSVEDTLICFVYIFELVVGFAPLVV
jgi:hypothetical protein